MKILEKNGIRMYLVLTRYILMPFFTCLQKLAVLDPAVCSQYIIIHFVTDGRTCGVQNGVIGVQNGVTGVQNGVIGVPKGVIGV